MRSILTLSGILSLLICFSFQIQAQRGINNNSTITDLSKVNQNANNFSWVGEFEYQDPNSGTDYKLVIEEEDGKLIGKLTVQGSSRLELDGRIVARVENINNGIALHYSSHRPIHSSPDQQPAQGVLLLKLTVNNNKIHTHWSDLRPLNFDASTNGAEFFRKID